MSGYAKILKIMKKKLFAAAIVFAAILVVPMRAEVIEQVLVKVNGDIITKTELESRQVAAIRERMQGKVDAEAMKNDATLKKMLAEMDRFSPEAVMKSWLALVPPNAERMQELFASMFGRAMGGSGAKKNG